MEANNMAAMREALVKIRDMMLNGGFNGKRPAYIVNICDTALSVPPRKGRWENGDDYEYEFAYCSECGRMQWACWDTHRQAEENIESFADDYRFCPGCGAEMEGGVYVK